MADDELITIGRFAKLTGLSIHTLRHYDDVGLLTPAEVDSSTGYRRYQRSQVQSARLIRALRWVDLPVEEVCAAVSDESGAVAADLLRSHRRRLERQERELADRLATVDYYLEKGIPMAPVTGARPVQLKLAVDDVDAGLTFYQEAFGFHYDVTRRTGDAEYSSFVFSQYGEADFFLLHLVCPEEGDRPGATTFGLLVEDLTEAHQRAIAAGATEVMAPRDLEGMPRTSAVKDPSGNWIWLYQG
ncbi:MAG TPA: MerR family transcriptional regulator [Acidimicrobiales bacterium]